MAVATLPVLGTGQEALRPVPSGRVGHGPGCSPAGYRAIPDDGRRTAGPGGWVGNKHIAWRAGRRLSGLYGTVAASAGALSVRRRAGALLAGCCVILKCCVSMVSRA